MEKNDLKNIKISEYLELLKNNTDTERVKDIDSILNSSMTTGAGGFDLRLFQLNKDLLVFHCKYMLAMLSFDDKKMSLYSKRIEEIRKELKKKEKKKEKADPYSSFLQWLLTLKKYYGSDIDRDNDLFYLVEATNSMMKYYAAQESNIENNVEK